jgi:hypothetical protein
MFNTILVGILCALTAVFFWLAGKAATGLDRTPQWVRWLCLFPSAVIFAVLSVFPMHWIIRLLQHGKDEDRWFSEETAGVIEKYAMFLVIPFALIFAGSRIAPHHKRVVTVILATVVLASEAIGLYLLVNADGFQIEEPAKFYPAVGLVVVGSLAGIYGAQKAAAK